MPKIRSAALAALLVMLTAQASGCGEPTKTDAADASTPSGPPAASPSAASTSGPSSPSPPRAAVEPKVVKTTGTRGVALTFDDGPDPYQTPAMLELLRQYGVKATFCLIGVNVQKHPEQVRAIVRDGHTLCNHSWSHDLNLGKRSWTKIRDDLKRTTDEIFRAAPGQQVKYFRQPAETGPRRFWKSPRNWE